MVAPWVWAVAAAALAAAIAAEVLLGRRALRTGASGAGRSGASGAGTTRRAIGWVGVYVSLAAAFGLALGFTAGWVTAGQFYTGYLTEYSLSLDNLFVFSVIMTWFAVPAARQPRILLLGIGLALVMRSGLIVAGAAALNRFGWLFYPLGVVLVWTAIGLIRGSTDGPDGDPERHVRLAGWLRRQSERQGGRPLLLIAAAIGVADLLFAFDSIPAIFGITTSAVLVVACNVFALMGLRQLYALLAGVLGRIVYLNTGLGLICAFIGVKLLLRALHGSGVGWAADIPAWLSVLVVAGVLLATVGAGLIDGRRPHGRLARTMLQRRFAVVDTDGNGVWQWDDCRLLTQRLSQTFGYAADSPAGRAVTTALGTLFDTMLSHLDANRDGVISREEFVAGVGPDLAGRPEFDAAVGATARSLLQVADADGNGVLDPGEYTRLAAVYGARADQAERAFGRLDQDRNGVLDATELTLAISQFFASRDPGGYGNVVFGDV
ncbi:MAG TPA: EF-hand domain-containing protein [Streptosporangiaceae bacterium]|nr:EF-hand domain-containing protein [Streptosporangiaceae bacterium]